MLESESRRITQKESCILLAFGIPRRALFTTEKKRKNNSAAQARPREARSLLASATTLQREATVPHSSLEHLVSNTCVSDSLNLSQKDQNSAIQEKKSPSLRNWHPSKCSTSIQNSNVQLKKIHDTTSQASMELTFVVSMLAFFERQSCTVATSPL